MSMLIRHRFSNERWGRGGGGRPEDLPLLFCTSVCYILHYGDWFVTGNKGKIGFNNCKTLIVINTSPRKFPYLANTNIPA